MKVKLSAIARGMWEGGVVDLDTGAVYLLKCDRDSRKMICDQVDMKNTSKYMYLPGVNCTMILDEFIQMQHYDEKILQECQYHYTPTYPELIPLEKLYSYRTEVSPGLYAMDEYIEGLYMDGDMDLYLRMRLYGIARKWCRKHGWEIIEDYLTFRNTM